MTWAILVRFTMERHRTCGFFRHVVRKSTLNVKPVNKVFNGLYIQSVIIKVLCSIKLTSLSVTQLKCSSKILDLLLFQILSSSIFLLQNTFLYFLPSYLVSHPNSPITTSCRTTTKAGVRTPTRFITSTMLRFTLGLRRLSVAPRLYTSSCPAGTVLNLKVRKAGDEPVALEDSEYPEWLWDVLDKEKTAQQLQELDPFKWRKKQLQKQRNAKIKASNFLSEM